MQIKIRHRPVVATPFISIYFDMLLRRYMERTNYVAFDVETTGLDTKKARIFAYILTWPNGTSEVHRVDTKDYKHNIAGWKRLKEIFADPKYTIIAHNFKYEWKMLIRHKIFVHPEQVWHDTMLMSRLLRNLWPSHSLDYAPYVLCGYTAKYDLEVKRQAEARGGRYDRVDTGLMHKYQIADGERTMLLFLTWIDEFRNNALFYQDYIMEIECTKTSIDMERFGIQLDWDESNKLIEQLDEDLHNLTGEVFSYLGEYVNLNSEKQLTRLFYKTFNFPIVKRTKTKVPAVDKDVINKLKNMGYDDPILDMTLKWRTWANALSMIRGYQERASAEGILYPSINTCVAKTRRQSTDNPSLQNVSKGANLDNPYAVKTRKCFRCHDGGILLLPDYSGIEMRLIIEAAKCTKMIDAMKRGEHPHIIASEIFYPKLDFTDGIYKDPAYQECSYAKGFRSKDLDKMLYDCAKNGHFGLGYGSGKEGLGGTLKYINPKIEGPMAYDRYADEYPDIAFLNRNIAHIIKEQGFVELPWGGKLYAPPGKAYIGLNYLIQGTAAIILKRAIVMLRKYLRERWDDRIKLIISIHDELVIHFPVNLLDYLDIFVLEASVIMVEMPYISVPLEVEWKRTDTTWDKAVGFDIDWNSVLALSRKGFTYESIF